MKISGKLLVNFKYDRNQIKRNGSSGVTISILKSKYLQMISSSFFQKYLEILCSLITSSNFKSIKKKKMDI